MFIHFDEGDPGKIMFFPNYFRLSQRAFELCLRQHEVPWREWFDHPDWGVPLRKVTSEYFHPIKPGQMAEVEVAVHRVGDSSVTLHTQIKNEDGKLCAAIETTHVFASTKSLKSIPIPDFLREFLSRI